MAQGFSAWARIAWWRPIAVCLPAIGVHLMGGRTPDDAAVTQIGHNPADAGHKTQTACVDAADTRAGQGGHH
jgi:hypothetical protein